MAAFATYVTFEVFPVLYGKRWIPLICIAAYFFLFEAGYEGVWKRLRKNSN